jgi:hypothetical protein
MHFLGLLTVWLIGAAWAKPIKKLKRQTIQDEYDFIICGGALLCSGVFSY